MPLRLVLKVFQGCQALRLGQDFLFAPPVSQLLLALEENTPGSIHLPCGNSCVFPWRCKVGFLPSPQLINPSLDSGASAPLSRSPPFMSCQSRRFLSNRTLRTRGTAFAVCSFDGLSSAGPRLTLRILSASWRDWSSVGPLAPGACWRRSGPNLPRSGAARSTQPCVLPRTPRCCLKTLIQRNGSRRLSGFGPLFIDTRPPSPSPLILETAVVTGVLPSANDHPETTVLVSGGISTLCDRPCHVGN